MEIKSLTFWLFTFCSLITTLGLPNSGSDGSGSLFSELTRKVNIGTDVPIFTFQRDMELALQHLDDGNGNIDEIDAKILYGRYIELLKRYYYERFLLGMRDPGCDVQEIKQHSLSEFNVAAAKSTPASRTDSWAYGDYLCELETDIDSCIDSLAEEVAGPLDVEGREVVNGRMGFFAENNDPCRRRLDRYMFWIQPKWRRRLRWVGSKVALLALNMAQFEWARRQSVRNAEKRLAEVPEFPLL